MKLTDLAIEKLKPSAGQVTYYDLTLPIGFGLRVGARRKTFIVVDPRGRRIKLGVYPHCTLAEARRLALQARHGPKTNPDSPPLHRCVDDYRLALDGPSIRKIKAGEMEMAENADDAAGATSTNGASAVKAAKGAKK